MKIPTFACLLLSLAACQARTPTQPAHPIAAAAPATTVPPRCAAPKTASVLLTASPAEGIPSGPCVERARALVATLPLRAKLGQMLQADRGRFAREPSLLTELGIGSLLSGGGSAPNDNTALGWAKMVNGFQEQTLKADSRLPLLYGIDAVHGHNNVYGAVIFPHNIGLGATRDPGLVERVGAVTAREVAATQIDWTFSPVLAAARDERWGRTYEAFGETSELAEQLGPAMIRGLQGKRLGEEPGSVLACAKHFLGDGHTLGGKDQGNAPLDTETLRRDLVPAYAAAIQAGVGSIMVSYSSMDGVKMHCHGELLNDLLKGELGFRGFLVSDWKAIEQLPGSYDDQLVAAINSGLDMIMEPQDPVDTLKRLERLVPSHISVDRIDDAVTRIVAAKCAVGLLEPGRFARDRSGQIGMRGDLLGAFGSAEHRQVAREAVQASLVLLKNDANTLPIAADARLHITGSGADDIGRQSGGWTITWQGASGPITVGTTIRQAFTQALPTGHVSYAKQAIPSDTDLVIVVASERPYAEGQGDDPDLALSPEDIELVAAAKRAGKRTVLLLLSGRPMMLAPVLTADAVVAGWLPGSEGAGVADVLLGHVAFRGRLPHTWPRSIEQVPINIGDANYDPLFAYGFGLTIDAATRVTAPLN